MIGSSFYFPSRLLGPTCLYIHFYRFLPPAMLLGPTHLSFLDKSSCLPTRLFEDQDYQAAKSIHIILNLSLNCNKFTISFLPK